MAAAPPEKQREELRHPSRGRRTFPRGTGVLTPASLGGTMRPMRVRSFAGLLTATSAVFGQACGADADAPGTRREPNEPRDHRVAAERDGGVVPDTSTDKQGGLDVAAERDASSVADDALPLLPLPAPSGPSSPLAERDAGPPNDAGVREPTDAGGGREPTDAQQGEAGALEPMTLTEALAGIWTLANDIDGDCERVAYWWFHSLPRLEFITVETNCVESGRIQTIQTGDYQVDGRRLTTTFVDRREELLVAHGTIDGERVLHRYSYTALSESRFGTSYVFEMFDSDGVTSHRSEAVSELSFDRPIPLDGEGDCTVSARLDVVSYDRFDEAGNELPEAQREATTSARSEAMACSYGPDEYGQRIQVAAAFFSDQTTAASPNLLEDVMWIDPAQPDVLFMDHWVFRYDVLPQGL